MTSGTSPSGTTHGASNPKSPEAEGPPVFNYSYFSTGPPESSTSTSSNANAGNQRSIEAAPLSVITTEKCGLVGPVNGVWTVKHNSQIAPFKAYLEKNGFTKDNPASFQHRVEQIDVAWQALIDNTLFDLPPGSWKQLPHYEFFQHMHKAFPTEQTAQISTFLTYTDAVNAFIDKEVGDAASALWTANFNEDIKVMRKLAAQNSSLDQLYAMTDAEKEESYQKKLVERVRERLWDKATAITKKDSRNVMLQSFLGEVDAMVATPQAQFNTFTPLLPATTKVTDEHETATSIAAYIRAIMSTGNYLHVNLVDKARRLCGTEVHTQPQGDPKGGPSKGSGKGSPRPGSQSNKSDTETTKKADVDKSNDAPYCRGCGRKHPAECELGPKGVNHPDWNDTKKSWSQSKIGLRWKEHKKYSLPWNKSLNDPSWTNPKPLKSAKRDADKPDDNPTKKRKCKSHTIMTTQHIKNEHSYLLTCSLSTTFSEIPDEFECLLDTGALDTNYVSRAVGDLIIKKGGTRKPCSVEKICSCSSKVCVPCLGVVHFDLTFFNDLTKKREKICLTATIIEMDFDIILGRRDIYKHKILFKTYNQMFADLIDQS